MAVNDGKPSILFAVPTGLGHECPELGRWLLMQGYALGHFQAVEKLIHYHPQSSRILLNRNMIAEEALKGRFDYICMIDPDMDPDRYLASGGVPKIPSQRPFIGVAMEFLRTHPFAVIGAPATCVMGDEDNRTLRVNAWLFDNSNPKFLGRPATHQEAAQRVREGRIEHVAAIGTGLIMIPTPVLCGLKRPFFDDEYNEGKTVLDKSQDVYFTESLTNAGIEVYCAWCSYAGHKKSFILGCPGIEELPQSDCGKESFNATSPRWQAPVSLDIPSETP